MRSDWPVSNGQFQQDLADYPPENDSIVEGASASGRRESVRVYLAVPLPED